MWIVKQNEFKAVLFDKFFFFVLRFMSRKLSLFISVLFHPVFVNLLSLLLLFVLFPYLQFAIGDGLKTFYVLFIFITTGILPVLVVLTMKLLGKTSSIVLDNKDERTTPYLVTSSIYLFDYYLFLKMGAPQLLSAYLLACSSIVVLVLIINLADKISIHSASLGALTGVIISATHTATFDIRIVLVLVFIITGLTASARLFANSHKPYQLLAGYLLGLMMMIFIL